MHSLQFFFPSYGSFYSPTFVSFVARARHARRAFCLLSVCHVIGPLSLRRFQCHSSNVLNRNNSTSAEVRTSGGSVYYIGRDVQLPDTFTIRAFVRNCMRAIYGIAFMVASSIGSIKVLRYRKTVLWLCVSHSLIHSLSGKRSFMARLLSDDSATFRHFSLTVSIKYNNSSALFLL